MPYFSAFESNLVHIAIVYTLNSFILLTTEYETLLVIKLMKFLSSRFLLPLLLLVCTEGLYGCIPAINTIPPKDPLPIDGNWIVDSSTWFFGNCTVQFDRGRAYSSKDCSAYREGGVIYKDITLMPDGSYMATDIYNGNQKIEVISPTQIRSKLYILHKIESTQKAPSASPSLEPKIGATELDADLKKVVLNQVTVSVPFGSSQTFTSGVQNKRSIDVSKDWNVSAEVKGEIGTYWAKASTEIKSVISSSTRSNDENSEEKKTSITLNGNDKPDSRYIVRWIKYYKTGTVAMETKQGEVNVPFEVEDHPSIEAEKIN